MLFQEGEDGDLFYIIIQGEVEVLKASHQVIEYDSRAYSKPLAERKMEDKLNAYYKCFKQYYNDIFWPQMDIHREDVDVIMGIDDERNNINFAAPLNEFRKGIL